MTHEGVVGATTPRRSTLTGRFNVENILAAYGASGGIGRFRRPDGARDCSRVSAVRGRFEQIPFDPGLDRNRRLRPYAGCARECPDDHPGSVPRIGRQGRSLPYLAVEEIGTRTNVRRWDALQRDERGVRSLRRTIRGNEDPQSSSIRLWRGCFPERRVYTEVDRRRAIVKALLLAEPG